VAQQPIRSWSGDQLSWLAGNPIIEAQPRPILRDGGDTALLHDERPSGAMARYGIDAAVVWCEQLLHRPKISRWC
jgi:hypothetical protein